MTERLLRASYTSPCYVCKQPMPADRNIMWDREHKRGRHLSCEPLVNPPAPPGIAQPQQRPLDPHTIVAQRAFDDPGTLHARNTFSAAPPVFKPGLSRLRAAFTELISLGCPADLFEAALGIAVDDAARAHERHVQEALDAASREAGNGGGISLEDAGFGNLVVNAPLAALIAHAEAAQEEEKPATLAAVFAKEDPPKPEASAYAGLSAWLDQPKKE